MVIGDSLQKATQTLTDAGIENPRLDAEVLLAHLLGQERLYLLLHRKDEVPPHIQTAYESLIARRSAHEPTAYLTCRREFMSLSFSVEPGVLIPRPDTETLVELVLKQYEPQEKLSVLDLCTGSGAIAVSLAYYLKNSFVTGVDINPLCVELAAKNAAENKVADRTCFKTGDVLKPLENPVLYDCVVSNPPYIPTAVLETLSPDVRLYEPSLALDGGEDGLTFYRYLVEAASQWLKPGGLLAFETGHDQAETVAEMMKKTGWFETVDTEKDLAGIKRVAYGIRA